MLVEPQRVMAHHGQTPLSFAGGRAIEFQDMSTPADPLMRYVGRVFELEGRHWTVRQFFLPLARDRTVRSGVRALVADEWGFLGFVNQRDLELLLGLKRPKEWCQWLGAAYPEFDSPAFYGVCADNVDLLDELHAHELELRRQYGGMLPGGLEYSRLVHREKGTDVQQLIAFLWDADPRTGMSPDPRFETLESRWVRVQEERVEWR